MPILKDRRSSPRRKQLKAGVVVFNARRSTIACLVRDISETGARIEVEQALVPDTFQLVIDLDGLEAECAVVWRRGSLIGVMFTSPPKNRPPRRVQVVTPTSPGTRPSLRRNPAK